MADETEEQTTRELIAGTMAALAMIADALCRDEGSAALRQRLIGRLSEAAAATRSKAPGAAYPLDYLVEMLVRGIADPPSPPPPKRARRPRESRPGP
jgi:hypothetical protein